MKQVLQIGPRPYDCITTEGNHLLLPFDSHENIKPQDSQIVIANPGLPVKLISFFLTRDVAKSFDLWDLIFGKNSQFAATGAISFENFIIHDRNTKGESFETDHARVPVALTGPFACFNAVVPGIDIILHVVNIGQEPKRFRACAIVEPYQPPTYGELEGSPERPGSLGGLYILAANLRKIARQLENLGQ